MIYQIMFNVSWVVLVVTSLLIGVGLYLLFTFYNTLENPEPPVFSKVMEITCEVWMFALIFTIAMGLFTLFGAPW
ncbi:hypothetical protein ACE414_10535 [Alteromonas macleodii]|uniref:hypothetical protein n=1 Tax=Alteromonas macleodii TaxID=28108 RepID=UPI00364CA9AD